MVWSIILWVMLALSILFLSAFSFIFIFRKILRKKDYAIKEKFNYLANNPVASNLKSIQNLVNNNSNLSSILVYLESGNSNYQEQTKNLKKQLQENSKALKSYSLFSIYEQLKQSERNIKLLEKEHEHFKKYSLNTEEYSNYASKISIDLFSLSSSLESFFKKSTLYLTFSKQESRQKISKNINNINGEINKQLNIINSTDLHKFFARQIINIKNLYELYTNLFEVEKYNVAINSIIARIQETTNENQQVQKSNIKNIIERTKLDLNGINKLLMKNNFSEAKNQAIEELEYLEKIRQEIDSQKFYNELFDRYFQSFKESVNQFYEVLKKHSIKEVYKSLLKNFNTDKEINVLTQNNVELTNSIIYEINHLNEALDKKSNNYQNIVNSMIKICEQIIAFKNENDNLYKKTRKKYEDFIQLSLKLDDLEIKLVHIKKIARELGVDNKDIMNLADTHRKEIKGIHESFLKNYNNKNDSMEAKIKSVEEFIDSSLETLRLNLALIEIYNKIRLFANRYYDKETKKELEAIDSIYTQKKYEQAINMCIEFINKYRKVKKMA